jgi:hypothetical protein
MASCPGCGAYVVKEVDPVVGIQKGDYCSSCRSEAHKDGRELGSDMWLYVLALGLILAALKWIFELIWDYKWWIIATAIFVYLYFKFKTKS